MVNNIQILKDETINRIAAGEVIERPSSVVKELIENSLDADATNIDIFVEDSGKYLIKVVDNGRGMSDKDAVLCLERHATSKIKDDSDLLTINSFGFRGEALPSIAAVSQFMLITKSKNTEIGTRIDMEGGKNINHDQAGCPEGTTIEVRNLFFNTPARRKFLKKGSTERKHIVDIITRFAIAHPLVGFRLICDNRQIISAPSSNDLNTRIAQLLGSDFYSKMYSVSYSSESAEIHGLICSPDKTFTTRRNIYIFINKRSVRENSLVHSLLLAYSNLLENRRFPAAVLFFTLPYEDLDVNVHPQKLEVRLRRVADVSKALREAVRNVLSSSPWKLMSSDKRLQNYESSSDLQGEFSASENKSTYSLNKFNNKKAGFSEYGKKIHSTLDSPINSMSDLNQNSELRHLEGQKELVYNEKQNYGDLEIIGQLWAKYLVCYNNDDMVIIDQHAAHERITYEKILKSFKSGSVTAQRLMFPVRIDLSPIELQVVEENCEKLSELGLEVEVFGGKSIAIKSVPALLSESSPEKLVKDTIDELLQAGQAFSYIKHVESIISRIACHSSIRGTKRLNDKEIKVLLKDLDTVDFSANCPHGRPIDVTYSVNEVDKWFHRV